MTTLAFRSTLAATALMALAGGSALAQDRQMPQPSTQSPQAAQGEVQHSEKMSGETTGALKNDPSSPKSGLPADCKDTLAKQKTSDQGKVQDCGAQSE